MRTTTKLSLAALCLAWTLGGCAGPLPKSAPNEAGVDLHDDISDAMLAEKIDKHNVPDGRYFELSPGAHQLSVLLCHVRTSNEEEDCTGSVDYGNFGPGQRYSLVIR